MTEKNREIAERKARRKPPIPYTRKTKSRREVEKQIDRRAKAKGWAD